MTSTGWTKTGAQPATRASSAVLIVSLLVIFAVSPARADANSVGEQANDVAAQVTAVAPDGADAVAASRSNGVITAEAGRVEATVPVDAVDGVVVAAAESDRELSARIALPSEMQVGEGVLASDGTVVFSEQTRDADKGAITVQTLADGSTRIHTVIADQDSEHEFGYAMDGYRATIDDQGNAGFISDGSGAVYVPVEAAWAIDANGSAVSTHYEIRGDSLVQVVVPDAGTAYPVVADPTWQWRSAAWGMTLSRKETASIKDYAVAAGMCAAFVKKSVLAGGCGAYAAYIPTQAVTANKLKPKGCLHLVAAPVPGAIIHVKC